MLNDKDRRIRNLLLVSKRVFKVEQAKNYRILSQSHDVPEVLPVADRQQPIDPNDEQLQKLRGDVDIANTNIKVRAAGVR